MTKLLRNQYTHDRPDTEHDEVMEALAAISLVVRQVERAEVRVREVDPHGDGGTEPAASA